MKFTFKKVAMSASSAAFLNSLFFFKRSFDFDQYFWGRFAFFSERIFRFACACSYPVKSISNMKFWLPGTYKLWNLCCKIFVCFANSSCASIKIIWTFNNISFLDLPFVRNSRGTVLLVDWQAFVCVPKIFAKRVNFINWRSLANPKMVLNCVLVRSTVAAVFLETVFSLKNFNKFL